jgi:hypothetical protein
MTKETLLTALKVNAEVLSDMVGAIPAVELERVRKPGYWTIMKHLNHLVITQIMLTRRVELFIKEERPSIQPYTPRDNEDSPQAFKDAKELVEGFAKWREKQIKLIEGCDAKVWKRTALHPEYRDYSFEILVRHIVLHDYFHLNRIEELWLLKDEYLKAL